MEDKIYDLAILGAGPAGISAAIYAARADLDTLWLDNKFVPGGQVMDTYEVDNYPGLPGITGIGLGEAMAAHAEKLGMKPQRELVRAVGEENGVKVLLTKKNEYRAKTVIIACGASHRKLEIPGEEELSGMGVSYCATCDGAFFKDCTTAVIGGGNVAVEDAIFLSRICRKVYLIHRRGALRADRILQKKLSGCENVEIVWDSVPVAIEGTDAVESLKIQNVRSNEETVLTVQGVFVAVGIVPDTGRFEELVELDENGYIIAGEDCVTSASGIFAAGDIRTKNLRQVVTAAADGANAVTSVQRWLIEEK